MKQLLYILFIYGLISCEHKEQEGNLIKEQSLNSLYKKDTLSLNEFRIIAGHLTQVLNLDSVSITSDTNIRRLIKISNTYRFELCPHETSMVPEYSVIQNLVSNSLLRKNLLDRYKSAHYNSWRGVLKVDELGISLGYFLSERYHLIPTDTCKRHIGFFARDSGVEF